MIKVIGDIAELFFGLRSLNDRVLATVHFPVENISIEQEWYVQTVAQINIFPGYLCAAGNQVFCHALLSSRYFYCQCTNPSIIVRLHDQGASKSVE